MIDIVTVFHRPHNKVLAERLRESLEEHEPDLPFWAVDNTKINRGFSKACNLGATWGEQPVIGFLNPDVTVSGSFARQVVETLENRSIVITGEDFNKPNREVRIWGLNGWCCGAAFFVRRDWFEKVGGFDERFVMYFEETDMCRRAEQEGKKVVPIRLPIEHESPVDDPVSDVRYKNHHFTRSAQLYRRKWR